MADTHLINSNQQFEPNHSLYNSKRSFIKCVIERKKCVFCQQFFDNDDFREHVAECTGPENIPPDSPVSSIQKPINDEKSISD
jgi:hypothetical protein